MLKELSCIHSKSEDPRFMLLYHLTSESYNLQVLQSFRLSLIRSTYPCHKKVTLGLHKNKTFFCLFFQVSICLQRGIWPAHRNFLSSKNCILRQIPSLLKNSSVILPSCLFCNSTVFFPPLSLFIFFLIMPLAFEGEKKGNWKERKTKIF